MNRSPVPDSAVIDETRALADAGRFDEAIALLTDACDDTDDRLEIWLAELRHRGGVATLHDPPGAAPLAAGTSPPVGDRGLPETGLEHLGAADLRAALTVHGCVLVPGAVGDGDVEQLVRTIDRSLEEQHLATTVEPRPPDSAWWHPLRLERPDASSLGRKWVAGGGGVLLADAPRAMVRLIDLFGRIGLRDLVIDYLGGTALLSANKNTLRRVAVDAVGGWHQDGAFLGAGIRAVNVWLALTRCGTDAPGLDIVPRRFDEVVETGTGGSYFDWAVGDAVVAEVAGRDGVIRPEFDAGDVLIFDEMLLHRTATSPSMTRDRYAVESWSFAPAAYPEGQVPLLW